MRIADILVDAYLLPLKIEGSYVHFRMKLVPGYFDTLAKL